MRQLLTIIIGVLITGCTFNEKSVLFIDNFDGNTLNTANWNYDLGNGCPELCGWGNSERQYYTRDNVTVENGHLIVRASMKDSIYSSGKIHSKNKIEFQYGSIEVKAKLPKGEGLWPAIWMLGHDIDSKKWPDCGEIDIMEYVGKEPHTIYTSLHTPDSHGNTINSKKTINRSIEKGFHVYKTTWTKKSLEFFIDNEKVYTFSPKEKNTNTWPFDKPFYIIINMAVGGNFGGPEVDDTIFPQEFVIDYVKVTSL